MRAYRRAHPEEVAQGAFTPRNLTADSWILSGPAVATVALLGRPNVGKSTLFNRLVRRRQALVHDQPGVTRDRIEAQMGLEAHGRRFRLRLVDTGGLTEETEGELPEAMSEQSWRAAQDADVVLLVVDAQAGLMPLEHELAKRLRRSNKAFAVVVNKIDVEKHEQLANEFFALGSEHVWLVSGEHARNLEVLFASLANLLEHTGIAGEPVIAVNDEHPHEHDLVAVDEDEQGVARPQGPSRIELPERAIRVAVVGRPNAGKSSLVNALLGEERLVASATAGTTRDAVDTFLLFDKQPLVLIDTAGIRRRRAVTERIEALTVDMAFASLDRADVAILVLDGTERPSDQDGRIAALAHEKGCALVIAANKWDCVENPEWKERFPKAVHHDWALQAYAPVVPTSATRKQGLVQLLEAVVAAQTERHRRVTTGELNRFFREVVEANPPPVRGGRRPKLVYVSQPQVGPPTFVFSTRGGGNISQSYRRYLTSALRRRYGFAGTPLWLKFRTPAKEANPYI